MFALPYRLSLTNSCGACYHWLTIGMEFVPWRVLSVWVWNVGVDNFLQFGIKLFNSNVDQWMGTSLIPINASIPKGYMLNPSLYKWSSLLPSVTVSSIAMYCFVSVGLPVASVYLVGEGVFIFRTVRLQLRLYPSI